MKVGFLSNQLDNRGTGNALFSYAHYNEILLGNKSKIFTFEGYNHDAYAQSKFRDRFKDVKYIHNASSIRDVDVLYHIKFGNNDGIRINPNIRYAVHSVFEIMPHGDRYAAVSRWLSESKEPNVPYVPHIIDPFSTSTSFRAELKIGPNAIVIGRHGGYDSFDIPWVWDALDDALTEMPDLHVILMNTKEHIYHRRIHYLRDGGPYEVRKLINTCDAMIHARQRGETFGIAVGEFASLGKPVITFEGSPERAHIDELGDQGLYYNDAEEVLDFIRDIRNGNIGMRFGYLQFSPTNVMQKFNEVFLS